MKMNLRFIFVAVVTAYLGFIGGMVWQMELTHRAPNCAQYLRFTQAQTDAAWGAGYAWGLAECAGEDQ